MKQYLKKLGCCLLMLLLGGFFLLIAWTILLLYGPPPYVTYAIGLLGLTGLIALGLRILLGQRGRRVIKIGYLVLCAAAVVYVGHGIWRDQIPTTDDRLQMLWQYQPYAPDTKAVQLEDPPH